MCVAVLWCVDASPLARTEKAREQSENDAPPSGEKAPLRHTHIHTHSRMRKTTEAKKATHKKKDIRNRFPVAFSSTSCAGVVHHSLHRAVTHRELRRLIISTQITAQTHSHLCIVFRTGKETEGRCPSICLFLMGRKKKGHLPNQPTGRTCRQAR